MFSDFIEATRGDQFVWGQNDCALWCASAVHHVTGLDPAADLRGTYGSRFEARQIIMRAGGLLSLIGPRMDRLGLAELSGDGVALLHLDRQIICGLVVEDRAVVKTERGLRVVDDFTVLRGWSCHRL